MSYTICFNLDQSKILSFGKELTLYQRSKCYPTPKLKPLAENKLNVTQNIKFNFHIVENIMENDKKYWLPQFSPFPIKFIGWLYWGLTPL